MLALHRWLVAALLATTASFGLVALPQTAAAQFGPPMTLFGSVTDAAGPIPENLPVEVYVGDRVCGKGNTQFTGDGDARVTVYYADVVSREQTGGCGVADAEVRIKIGDRFAPQTGRWRPGPVQVDLVFGNATPRPIPTFTPTPRREVTPSGTQQTPIPTVVPNGSATAAGTDATPSTSATAEAPSSPTATATLRGGVVTSGPGGQGGSSGDDGGGFPVWAGIAIGLGAIAAIGGGVGVMLARMRSAEARAEANADLGAPLDE